MASDGLRATLWLADYRQSSLHQVVGVEDAVGSDTDGLAVPVHDHWLGRVFASQRPATSGPAPGSVAVPVSVRGDRLGVLEVTVVEAAGSPAPDLAADLAADLVDGLAGVATQLAHELAAVGRFTDYFERFRRVRPMTLAAEIQWALLPAPATQAPTYALAGLLEPAYSVAGDAFDWAEDGERLTVVVCEGVGRGVSAALATSLGMTAMRNARRAPVPLEDQASLADQALYAHYGGSTYVAALLLELDLRTGSVRIVDAGSPHLLLVRGGEVGRVPLDAQLPLGMFEETHYRTQALQLEPGDRLVVVSDGVHESGSAGSFGDALLAETVRGARMLSAAETTRHLVRALHDHHGGRELDDDAVVVCLDWSGPAPS